jgi:hypothetical protein
MGGPAISKESNNLIGMSEPTEALGASEITYINYLPLNKASHSTTPEPSSSEKPVV